MDAIDSGPRALLREAGGGRVLDVLGAPYRVLATSAETGGRLAALECTLPPGAGAPPHAHTHEDETFHVCEGRIAFALGGAPPRHVGAGGFVFAPRGLVHAFVNDGAAPARMLALVTPGTGLEEMFAAFDAARGPGGAPPPVEALVAIAARHGVTIATPG